MRSLAFASGQEGAYAEKVAVKAAMLAKKPEGLSHIHAAALALTGLTALSAVEDTLQLRCGETILTQGGASGVAGFAIQLAKQIGARVITTASAVNHDYVRSLGTDEVIDYNAEEFTQVVSGCDAVFDTVGTRGDPEVLHRTQAGRPCVFIALGEEPPIAPRGDVTSLRPPVTRARRPLERIAGLFLGGAIRAPEIRLYRLAEAADAHRLSGSRHFRGKLVVAVQ
jgi:NADPH:quinone reductase-like Zn-dependent oxidoreductase